MAEVLIIGAGPAGLTAAYELGKDGHRSTVLEADQQVGGLARTVTYRGYRFDIGGHRFFSKVPLVNELWKEILGEDLLQRPRLSRIYYRGRYFDYPLKPLNALAGLGPLEALRIGASYAGARLFPAREERNFEQWVSNRFGRRLYEIFFKTYTEKVWGMPCSEISADWAAQRIKNLSLREAVVNALFRTEHGSDGRVVTSLIERFHYPRHGPGMMWERCAALVEQAGGTVRRGARVERIAHEHGRVQRIWARTDDGVLELRGDHVISTMAVSDLIAALDPPAPEAVRQAAQRLRYRDYLTVVLVIRRAQVFPDTWIYVHAPEVKLGRVQNYKNWSPEMVPDPTRTSLGLEYFLSAREPEWTWPDERLIDAGIRDCARIGLIEPHEVEDATTVRVPKAYPVYDHGWRENLAVIRDYVSTLSNLQLVGRNGQHRYNNQDHSMLAAVYAARNVAGGRYDVWTVNTDAEYHEGAEPAAAPEERLVPLPIAPAAARSSDAVLERAFARLDPVALGAAFGFVAGSGLLLATTILLLKGGSPVGPNLYLLSQYLVGFTVTWSGALIGMIGAGAGGFAFGYLTASLRNAALRAYARIVQRRAAAAAQRTLLDQV